MEVNKGSKVVKSVLIVGSGPGAYSFVEINDALVVLWVDNRELAFDPLLIFGKLLSLIFEGENSGFIIFSERDCPFTVIGDLLSDRGFGFCD